MRNMIVKYLTIILILAGVYLLAVYTPTAFLDFEAQKEQPHNNTRKKISELSKIPSYRPGCITEIHFTDTKIGWYSCNESLWETNDGGKTWDKLQEPSSNDLGARYFFLNSQIGWKYYGDSIKKTLDGGKSWGEVVSPILKRSGYISFLSFTTDGKNGWVAGDVYKSFSSGVLSELSPRVLSGNGKEGLIGFVYSTKDGGESWQEQNINLLAGETINDFIISKNARVVKLLTNEGLLHFDDDQWLKIDIKQKNCQGKRVAYTNNSETDNDSISYSMIYLFDDANGWLGLSDGTLLKTKDGGKTWCKLLEGVTLQSNPNMIDYFTQLHFISLTRGLGLTRGGKIYETFNGGVSWQVINSSDVFLQIFFLNESQGWGVTRESIYQLNLTS